ncbi:MAG TPA: O-antigen ligase family protein [Rhizomicrobium sp.]|jgi:O-antigen ligase|nr:O-antigen ligase family protein [Rhizomicrobium sp.]
MAVDAVAVAPRTHLRTGWSLADTAFMLFLVLVFIGLSPFATRDPLALAAGDRTGAGDLLREIAYSGAFLFVGFAALRAKGLAVLRGFPLFLALLLFWCMLSAAWAAAPDVTLRRAVLETVIVVSTMLGVASNGEERSLSLLRAVLGIVLIVNWISIPLIQNAVHMPGEIDPGLVGDWRGLYFHKNIAGAVSAITAILFFFQALKTRPLLNGAVCVAAIGFTFMTGSKSSLGLLPVAIALALLYGMAWRRGIDRAILSLAVLLVSLCAAVAVLKYWGHISHLLTDPTELTGRTAIWRGEVAYFRDHLLLGGGFGSFSDTGAVSLLHNYVSDQWVQSISHGHNAYLQILVTLGAAGFALAMAALVVSPAHDFWRFDPANLGTKTVLFAIFLFMVLHNAVESDFLEGDGPPWVAFLLMLACLRGCSLRPGQSAAESAR